MNTIEFFSEYFLCIIAFKGMYISYYRPSNMTTPLIWLSGAHTQIGPNSRLTLKKSVHSINFV